MFVVLWKIQRGGGVITSFKKRKIRGGGGSQTKFPPWWGYGYFLELRNTHSSSTYNFFIQESRLRVKLKSFSAFGARLWNCLHTDWRKLKKRAFKRKLHKLLLTVLGIEDYYVDAHSLILKFNANIKLLYPIALCFATCFV